MQCMRTYAATYVHEVPFLVPYMWLIYTVSKGILQHYVDAYIARLPSCSCQWAMIYIATL